MSKERPLDDYELSRPALELAKRFVARWDLYALQLPDGRYICVHEGLNVNLLFGHLRGEITLGAYLLDTESKSRSVVLDADDRSGLQRLSNLAVQLAKENVPSYLEASRRGGHLWFFLPKPTPARAAREFARGIVAAHEIEGVEIYPKQDRLRSGPGSLIRMPFGIHRLSSHRYGFYHPDGTPLAPSIREQLRVLSAPQTVSKELLAHYQSLSPSEPPPAPLTRLERSTGALSERIKSATTVLEFISQYVDLKPAHGGAVGRCPFHDDRRPSFGVNDRDNYWHCFAGCGGGSIIDFWMKYKEFSFTAAVKELAEMLL